MPSMSKDQSTAERVKANLYNIATHKTVAGVVLLVIGYLLCKLGSWL